ncbi:glycine oxidase ThiO [Colwellia sp. KU-HH00111]|uniref:glycine oxidase ThiO n=1 Tax=Colwellia sp. KU-HH00111 TaxID=3127652 RepID=UPI003105DBFC
MKIAIIGAGLMGRLLALSLHRNADYNVTLFDKDTRLAHSSAAYAAAGLLTPLGESLHCEASIVAMGFESLSLWPSLLASLDEHTFFQQTGAIMVSHEQDKGDYLRFVRHLKSHYPQHALHTVNRAQLNALEPELGRSFNQGLYLPEEGQIGNRRLLVALRKQLEQEGVDWLSECEVSAISQTSLDAQVSYREHHKKATQSFDLVIDCRGTGATLKKANSDCAPLSDLRAVRGELFQLFAPDVNLSRPIRLMHPRYQLYIAPKGKGFYVVGATEIESDDDSSMTVRSAMELLSAAYSVHPGFAEANIRQHISQCRPAFSDNQPKIIRDNSLIQVNGLFRHGFLIAPVVLAQITQLVSNIQHHATNHNVDDKQLLPYHNWLPIQYKTLEVSA